MAELGMSSTGLAWTSSDCDAALSNSKDALGLLGKRKREPQANLADERAALLSIRRLRLAYHSHGTKVMTWACERLKEHRTSSDGLNLDAQIASNLQSSVNRSLVDLIVGCLEVQSNDSRENQVLETFFQIIVNSSERPEDFMLWLLCHVATTLPDKIPIALQKIVVLEFQKLGNPYIEANKDEVTTPEQSRLATTLKAYFEYTMEKPRNVAKESVIWLLQDYSNIVKKSIDSPDTLMEDHDATEKVSHQDENDVARYYVSYLMSLIHISPRFANAVWRDIFCILYEDNRMGKMLLFEREKRYSYYKTNSNEPPFILADLFPRWLSQVAFSPSGLVMKHALDVAVMLDTIAHDEHLGMKELIPTKDNSIITGMKASFAVPDLKPASVDLVEWTVGLLKQNMGRVNEEAMQIPIFLLQLRGLQSKASAVELLSHLLLRLDKSSDADSNECTRYLIFHLINKLDERWSGVFRDVLDKIFSKLKASISKLTDEQNPDARVIERVLGSCSVIAEPCTDDAGVAAQATLHSFQSYLADEWKTVMSLFINHPALTCRISGFEVLLYSQFWTGVSDRDAEHDIADKLTQAWFRYLTERFSALHIRGEKDAALRKVISNLVHDMSQKPRIARQLLETFCDRIYEGALESFSQSKYLTVTLSDNWLLLDVYRKQMSVHVASADEPLGQVSRRPMGSRFKPRQPRYLAHLADTKIERSYQDDIYANNIMDTAHLIQQITQQHSDFGSQIVIRLSTKWPSVVTPMDKYDQMLPLSLPNERDGLIGNTFRDHPGLFDLLHHCYTDGQPGIHDLLRSLLAYYIAFWHMDIVKQAESPWDHAVQLENTHQLLDLLSQTGAIETQLYNCRHLLNSMSISDIGGLLYSAIWGYIRQCPVGSEIPGLGTTARPSSDMRLKHTMIAVDKVKVIVKHRLAHIVHRSKPSMEDLARQYEYL